MQDVSIKLANHPGALAALGSALGRANVNIQGGGVFVVGDHGIAHFLFDEGATARQALDVVGIDVVDVRDVIVLRLNQRRPGQLGEIARRMAEAGVNIEVMYSDHENQLILVVDDYESGRSVALGWEQS
jgi:hypothetical protein